jgi:transposase
VDWDALLARVEQLERENTALRAENERLRRALDEAQRSGKRQAAPFSRQAPKANPKKPGRKSGVGHGRHGHGAQPSQVDESVEAPLPECCPDCGGGIEAEEVVLQYQSDLPVPRLWHTAFHIHVG